MGKNPRSENGPGRYPSGSGDNRPTYTSAEPPSSTRTGPSRLHTASKSKRVKLSFANFLVAHRTMRPEDAIFAFVLFLSLRQNEGSKIFANRAFD